MNQKVSQRMQAAQRIAGYEILERVGQGAMGIVYKARQISMDRIVALKILGRNHTENPKYVEQFIREARVAGKIGSPYIIQVHDVGEESGVYYFSMEFVDDQTLWDRVKNGGRMSHHDVLPIAIQMASALDSAHKAGLVHRDVKPENIMLDSSGRAKLADLGLVIMGDQGQGEIVGTPHYMSPEQCRGEEVDIRSDIYSLGATLYRALCGTPPFGKGTAREIIQKRLAGDPPAVKELLPALPGAFAHILDKMMAADPDKRYQSPSDLLESLKRVEAGKLPEGYRPREIAASQSAARRAKLWKFALPLMLAAALIFFMFSESGKRARRRQPDVQAPAVPVPAPAVDPAPAIVPKEHAPSPPLRDDPEDVRSKPETVVPPVSDADPGRMMQQLFESVKTSANDAFLRHEYLTGWQVLSDFAKKMGDTDDALYAQWTQAKLDYQQRIRAVYKAKEDRAEQYFQRRQFEQAAAQYQALAGLIQIPELVEKAMRREQEIRQAGLLYVQKKKQEEWEQTRPLLSEVPTAMDKGRYEDLLQQMEARLEKVEFEETRRKLSFYVRDVQYQHEVMKRLPMALSGKAIMLSELGKHAMNGRIKSMKDGYLEIEAKQFSTQMPWSALPHDERLRLIDRVWPKPEAEIVLGKAGMAIAMKRYRTARIILSDEVLHADRWHAQVAWYTQIIDLHQSSEQEQAASDLFAQLQEQLQKGDYKQAQVTVKALRAKYSATTFYQEQADRLDQIAAKLQRLQARGSAGQEQTRLRSALENLGWRIRSGEWTIDSKKVIHVANTPAMIVRGDETASDAMVKVYVRIPASDCEVRIFVRYAENAEQFYRVIGAGESAIPGVGLIIGYREVRIVDTRPIGSEGMFNVPPGVPSVLSTRAISPGKWYLYQVSVKGDRLSIHVGNRKIHDVNVAYRPRHGMVALIVQGADCQMKSLSCKLSQ